MIYAPAGAVRNIRNAVDRPLSLTTDFFEESEKDCLRIIDIILRAQKSAWKN